MKFLSRQLVNGVAVSVALFAQPFAAQAVAAQEVQLAATTSSTTHVLLNAPLGGRVTLQYPLWSRVSIRGSAERTRTDEHHFGIPCTGLINPTSCPPEALHRESRIHDYAIGAAFALWDRDPLRVQLTGAHHVSKVSTETLAEASGRTAYGASQDYRGNSAGAELALAPRQFRGVELTLAFDRTWMDPHDVVYIADGYTPFYNKITASSVTLGLGWRFLSRHGSGR